MKTELTMKNGIRVAMVLIPVGFGMIACSQGHFDSDPATLTSQSVSLSSSSVGTLSMSVKDASSNTIYSDAVAGSSLKLKAGQTYKIMLQGTSVPAGSTFDLQSTRTDVIGASSQITSLNLGSNSFTVPTQGDYNWKIVSHSSMVQVAPKAYQAEVSCANPALSASSLNANNISVSQASPNNYNFSAANVVSSANQYTCAWDMTGTGIVDTGFKDCSQTVKLYTNDVGTRKVSLIVKDSCNTTVTVSKSVNLSYSIPQTGQQNVFIFGKFSNGAGLASTDARLANVEYLADNKGGGFTQAHYGNGQFTIQSSVKYGQLSSSDFGVKIALTGLSDSLNVSSLSGTVDASNARIASVTFLTDRAGDQSPAVSLKSTSCTLSNQNAIVTKVSGSPCASGTSGDNNQIKVEVYGDYTCTMQGPAGTTATFSGKFDGLDLQADSCSGGGGGGGGVVPVSF